jgi:hypothetical protein
MKRCFKCKEEKLLDEFYKHPAMGDGHLGKCKECTKKDVRERDDRLRLNPDFIKSERRRGREKYHRLYHGKYRTNKSSRKLYQYKYPEKYKAKCMSGQVMAPVGLEKHHWSYNEPHYKDVIFVSTRDHMRLHRYMIYDQERMMYRTTEGVLLDTRDKHEEYLKLTRTMI